MTPREARVLALRRAADLIDNEAPDVWETDGGLRRVACHDLARELRQQAVDLEDAAGEKVAKRRDRVKE